MTTALITQITTSCRTYSIPMINNYISCSERCLLVPNALIFCTSFFCKPGEQVHTHKDILPLLRSDYKRLQSTVDNILPLFHLSCTPRFFIGTLAEKTFLLKAENHRHVHIRLPESCLIIFILLGFWVLS